jgi:hypothetical protein
MMKISRHFQKECSMHHKLNLAAVIIALMMAILGCSLFEGDNNSPSESVSLPANVLFQDNFSDPSSGWDQVNEVEGSTDYVNGLYRIYVDEANYDIWANPGLNFTDTVIEVEATKVGGADDNDFGVICRYQGLDSFYFFIISSDGYYGIAKVVDGEQELIGMDNMEYSDAINQGSASNLLRVDCLGNQFTLYVNGEKVADASDSQYPSGDVGLIAGTFDIAGTDVHFDNFVVREP